MVEELKLSEKYEVKDTCSLLNHINERLGAGPKKTRIIFRNHDTGEEIGSYENKILVPGSQFNAMRVFGIDAVVPFKTYNEEMKLDNSSVEGAEHKNEPIVCLFCVSDSGCGTLPTEVIVSNFTDRIKPAPASPSSTSEFKSDMIMPFRYVSKAEDLDENLRKYYFGRKEFPALDRIGYYFKTFDTQPMLHVQYADGTPVTESLYNSTSNQSVECYVEMRLRITRLDFRDYFEQVLGWDKARISSLSLCFAWYDDEINEYKYYQDITPYSLLNFSYLALADLDLAVDVEYQIFY